MEYRLSNKMEYKTSSQLGYSHGYSSVSSSSFNPSEVKYRVGSPGNGDYSSKAPEMIKIGAPIKI